MKVTRTDSVNALRFHTQPLLGDHFREVGNTKMYDLDPDWDKYDAINDQGNLIALMAFDDLERCIGYSVSFLTPHVHYRRQLVAYNDVLFVREDMRESSAGGRLIVATNKAAKEAGAVCTQWHAKPGTALFNILLKRMPIFEHAFVQPL